MSDYPMLISNKLHSFRNFVRQISSISGRCCRCSHEPLIPYLAKISDLYPLAILKVDKLKDGSMAVDGEVGGNLLRGE